MQVNGDPFLSLLRKLTSSVTNPLVGCVDRGEQRTQIWDVVSISGYLAPNLTRAQIYHTTIFRRTRQFFTFRQSRFIL